VEDFVEQHRSVDGQISAEFHHQRSPPVVVQDVGIGIESQQCVDAAEVPEACCIVQCCVPVAAAPFVDLCPFPDKILDPAVIAILPAWEREVDCACDRHTFPHWFAIALSLSLSVCVCACACQHAQGRKSCSKIDEQGSWGHPPWQLCEAPLIPMP
jgi:hypothetical protein